MPGLQRLPREILARILSIVRNGSTQHGFLDCLLVCHNWQLIGAPHLFTTVVLTNEKLRLFVARDHKWLSLCGKHVRILSVRISSVWVIHNAEDGKPHLKVPDSHADRLASTAALRTHIGALSETIEKHMPLLTCFSLFVDHSHGSLAMKDNTWDAGFGIGVEELASLVKALPSTCSSLELDTDGRDMHKANTTHLCPIIRDFLPRLRHLRLRLKYICPSLLCKYPADDSENLSGTSHNFPAHLDTAEYVQARSLQSLVICLNIVNSYGMLWPWSFWRSELCSSLQDPPQTKQLRTGSVTVAPRPRVAAGTEVIAACQKATSGTADYPSFPSLKRCDIYEIAFYPDWDKKHTMIQRDILTDEIRFTPMRRMRSPEVQETWGVKTIDGAEHLGNVDEIERLIEGPAWLETKNELARLPAMIAVSEDSIEAGYQWKEVHLQSREEFESKADVGATRRQIKIPDVVVKHGMDWELQPGDPDLDPQSDSVEGSDSDSESGPDSENCS
ncbi:MAG: hypothetical protein M1812_001236 [Candelaria pacifica]|nr:MAG: hypothetical protein M1812_001236 [Candelaria pacifica]